MFDAKLKGSGQKKTYTVRLNLAGVEKFIGWLKNLTQKKVSIKIQSEGPSKSFTFSTIKERKAFATSLSFLHDFISDDMQKLKDTISRNKKSINSLDETVIRYKRIAEDREELRIKCNVMEISSTILKDRLAEVESTLDFLKSEVDKSAKLDKEHSKKHQVRANNGRKNSFRKTRKARDTRGSDKKTPS